MLDGELTTTAKHRHTDAPKLVHLIRGDLDWIVMKALEKDRGRRYETANGLADDIQRHLNNEPVVARPPSNLYRLQKSVQRNKLGFAAAALVALSLIIGLGISTWEFSQERQAHQRAVAAEREQSRLHEAAVHAQNVALDNVYAADIGLAKEALDQFQLPRARELLRSHIPKQGETDRRGVEWRYLSALARGEWIAAIPTSLDGGVSALAITPNDKFIIAAGVKGGLCVIGFEDFKMKSSTMAFASGGCSALDVSIDGQIIAVSGDGGNRSVSLWRLDTDGGLALIRRIDADSPYAIAISPDAKVLAVGTKANFWSGDFSEGGITKLFDIASVNELAALPESGGRVVAFSRDGKWLATGHWHGQGVKLWEPNTWKLTKTLPVGAPCTLQFSADSQSLLIGTIGGGLKLHKLLDDPLATTMQNEIYNQGGMPKNSGYIRRGPRDAEQAAAEELPKTYGYIRQAAISDDKRWEVLCCERAIFLTDRAASKSRQLFGHESAAQSVAFSHDGGLLLSGDRAGTLLLWSAAGSSERRTRMTESFTVGFRCLPEPPSSPDGRKIAIRTEVHGTATRGEVKVVDTLTRRVAPVLPTASWPLAFVDENTLVTLRGLEALETYNRVKPEWASSGAAPLLEFWNLAAVTNWSLSLEAIPNREISAVGISPDRRLIALAWRVGSKINGVALLSLTTGELRLSVSDIGSRIEGITFSPDGQWLVLACLNGTVPMVRVESGARGPVLRCEDVAEGPAFSADGKWLAVACWDAVRLFSMPDGHLNRTFTGGAFWARFSADGKTLITHGETFARWWHLPTGRQMFSTAWPWSVVPEAMILLNGENVAAGCYPTRPGIPDEWVVFQLPPLAGSDEWLRAQPSNLAEARR